MWPWPRKFSLTLEERHAEARKRAGQTLAAFAKMLEDTDSKSVMEGPGGCSGFLHVAYSMWQEALKQVEAECTIMPAGVTSPYVVGAHFETQEPPLGGGLTDEDLKALGIPQAMYPVPHPFVAPTAIISSAKAHCALCGELETSALHQETIES